MRIQGRNITSITLNLEYLRKAKTMIENLHMRISYIKNAPYFVGGGFAISFLLWIYADVTFQWYLVVINVIANSVIGLAIVARFLLGNIKWILALYSFGLVPITGIIYATSEYGELGALMVLSLSIPFWYLPQILFRRKLMDKIAKEMKKR